MMRKLVFLLFVLMLGFVGSDNIFAQISLGGTPVSLSFQKSVSIPSVRMEAVNHATLLAEDEIELTQGEKPMRFGFPFDVDYSMDNSGVWETLPDGSRLWRLRIECPGAYSINIVYSKFWLPAESRFFVYNEDQSMIMGAFSSHNNKDHGRFATGLCRGDVTILEYWEPADAIESGVIELERIVHGYRDFFNKRVFDQVIDPGGGDVGLDGFGSSGSCNNNVNCPEAADWQDQKRSVAMVILGNGTRWCSGTMINNVRQDFTPYFLTANHCLNSPSTFVIMFNYESPTCSNINGPTWMTVSGTTLRATATFSDFALLELSAQPPDTYNVYYSGWNAVDTAADSIVAIHHPAGDIKKITFDYDDITATSYLGNAVPGDNSHWRIRQWEDGTTEGGSSGSPIFDREKRVKGQLHGGYASCSSITSDWYGKFSISWANGGTASTRLKDWLDPDNTGTLVLDGRDAGGISITHIPLENTPDTLNDYVVLAEIISISALVPDSLKLHYEIASVWTEQLLVQTANPFEYTASIPAQSPGTTIRYLLTGADVSGNADTTDTISFSVISRGVEISPSPLSGAGPVDDTVWYDLSVINVGAFPDDYTITFNGNLWATELYDETGTFVISSTSTLASAEIFNFKLQVIVPVSLFGEADTVTITATSNTDPSIDTTGIVITASDGEPLTLPFIEKFPNTVFNNNHWVVTAGATINDVGLEEPSLPYSADFNGDPYGGDTLVSQALNLSGLDSVLLEYSYERTGGGDSPESGDDLLIEGLDSTGMWQLLSSHNGGGAEMTAYAPVQIVLPPIMNYGGFRLRIRSIGTLGAFDDWFVDDIFIGRQTFICGDVDGSGSEPVDVNDLTYLVAYLLQGGPPPPVPAAADLDGSGFILVDDLTFLVAFLFQGGPSPTCN